MLKWLKNKFKKKKLPEGIYNIHHPDMAGKTEFAFECEGVKYYRAVKDFILPVGRFQFIDEKLSEAEIRMNLPTLKGFIGDLKKNLDGSRGINLGKVWETIYKMESRCNLQFEPETVRQVASVVYFDETEDLRTYDAEYGKKKLAAWDKAGTYAFFLTQPILGSLIPSNTSEEYLREFIQKAGEVEGILKSLTLEQENP